MAARVTKLEIRVYPLVNKFLAYHYDTAPFAVDYLRNPYATYLQAQFDKRDWRDQAELPKRYGKLTERLTIGITPSYGRQFGQVHISPYREAAFNDFVKQMFFDRMTLEVSIHTSLGQGLKAALQAFLSRYSITEDDLPLKTAIENYYRLMRRQAKASTGLAANTPVLIGQITPPVQQAA